MKICEKCGAHNSDARNFCIDCSEALGESISDRQEEEINKSIRNKIEKMENESDPLAVTRFDKILGFVSIIGIILLIGLLIFGLFTKTDSAFLLWGVLFMALSSTEAFVPAIGWGIEKLRLSILYSNTDDVTPGMFYKIGRKLAILLSTAIGIAFIIFGILNFINSFNNKPVIDLIDAVANYESVSMSSNSNDYILASPNEWQEIIDGGEKSVNALIDELKKCDVTGLREILMMQAVNEITGYNLPLGSATEFVAEYTILNSLQKNY